MAIGPSEHSRGDEPARFAVDARVIDEDVTGSVFIQASGEPGHELV
jgi:hypothetical protein